MLSKLCSLESSLGGLRSWVGGRVDLSLSLVQPETPSLFDLYTRHLPEVLLVGEM